MFYSAGLVSSFGTFTFAGIIYARFNERFRRRVEREVPYSHYLFNFLYGKLNNETINFGELRSSIDEF